MSPELINAIKERLQAGQSRTEIESAVLAMGHQKEVFEAAFTLAEHDLRTSGQKSLPKVTTLFVNGWNFAKSRLDLVALLFVPLVLEVLASFWFGYSPETDNFPPFPLLAMFTLLGIVYIVILAIALFVVTSKSKEETLTTAFKWTVRNALPLLFIYVLSGLVVFGGFLFFIIPGVAVAIAITFAQYTFVREGKRGMESLLASRAVVKGRWFVVARKIAGFIFLTLILILIFGMLYGLVEMVVGEGRYMTLGGELLTQALSAVMSIINLHAMYHLYLALSETAVSTEVASKFVRGRYWLMAALTLGLMTVLLILATFYKESLSKWLEEANVPLEEMSTTVPASFGSLPVTALKHANEHEGSYTGVCALFRPLTEVDGEVTCNESDTAWALEVVNSTGVRYCADTATPGKQIHAPLGDKTECIVVAE
ncbi:MAG: hypothetical protein AAB618_03705 [Patescibacteria group bacterium]